MTDQQFKICKKVSRYKKLTAILEKTGISDYMELQETLGPGAIEFENVDDDNTEVFLSNALLEEVERRHHQTVSEWITRALSIAALIISIIALFRT